MLLLAMGVGLWSFHRTSDLVRAPFWLVAGPPGIAAAILLVAMLCSPTFDSTGRGIFWASLGWSLAFSAVLIAVVILLLRSTVSLADSGPVLGQLQKWLSIKKQLLIVVIQFFILCSIFSQSAVKGVKSDVPLKGEV